MIAKDWYWGSKLGWLVLRLLSMYYTGFTIYF